MATKLKTPAAVAAVPQNKTDCAAYIKNLGDVQRDFERQRAEMNDAIANITKAHQPALEALTTRLTNLQSGIHTWCEANRAVLCEGSSKTANLITGEVSWRQRPPSVGVRGADTVIETLQRMGLGRFVRTKEEINKEAMLNEPEAVRGIAGITIVSGVEDFSIAPFAVEVEAV
jgi:phage host-nuclease inhibitor protein Gam